MCSRELSRQLTSCMMGIKVGATKLFSICMIIKTSRGLGNVMGMISCVSRCSTISWISICSVWSSSMLCGSCMLLMGSVTGMGLLRLCAGLNWETHRCRCFGKRCIATRKFSTTGWCAI
jgi:hypothetical protein